MLITSDANYGKFTQIKLQLYNKIGSPPAATQTEDTICEPQAILPWFISDGCVLALGTRINIRLF
jgi:hypothetical protein